ncbi:MAG: hypothetical protein JWO80_1529 [Bryobacterales bacterium]|nr:hypothetical protein [Bryobacterales bacterium]
MHIHLKTVICAAMLSALASAQSTPPRARSTSNIVIQRPSGSYLGVAVVEIDSDRAKTLKLKEERGVEVKLVDENSPASKAGLKEGDVILEYNGQRIEGTTQFVRMVSETPAGRRASLQISRNGAPQTLPVTLEARSGRGGFALSLGDMSSIPPMPPMPPVPPAAPAVPEIPWSTPRLGIETESLNPQLAEFFGVKEGVLIRFVSKNSAAEKAGLKAGDVITRVNGDSIRNAGEITMKILPPNAGKTVSLTVVRNHKEMTVEVAMSSDRRSEAKYDTSCYTA